MPNRGMTGDSRAKAVRSGVFTANRGASAWGLAAFLALAAAALVWSFWKTAFELYRIWERSPDYSVGQLVLPTAAYLAWRRRSELVRAFRGPCWAGLALVAFACGLRIYGMMFLYESIERLALVLCLVGVVLTIGGAGVFWRLRWILAFLFLMLPMPARVHNTVSGPLQETSTTGAVFLLEVLGVTADREGFVLVLNDSVPLAVAEACSGLRMLTAFTVVASAMALLVARPGWMKAALVLSSVPIAVVCNLLRLVATALLFMGFGSATAQTFFHDFAGVTMMPMAVLLLMGELWLLDRIVVREPCGRRRTPAHAAGREALSRHTAPHSAARSGERHESWSKPTR
ncbi:MAG: exosortase/archaeosortase family protein [Phycisphaerae bacterium]